MQHDRLSLYESDPYGSPVSIIRVPLELGSDERGLAATPEYLHAHGLERMFEAVGCEISEQVEIVCPKPPMEAAGGVMKHVHEIATAGKRTRAAVEKAGRRGDRALVIGGDHSAAFGTVAGAAAAHPSLGVIYIDAHPDANTHETTISGNVHGMVASAMMGDGHPMLTEMASRAIAPEHFLFVGLKDFDKAEIQYIRERRVPAFTALDIATHGLAPVVSAIDSLARKVDAVWISMDMDSIDEQYAPGVAMSTPDGLTRREILGLAHTIGKRCTVAGMDISEMVPEKDRDGMTAKLAIELIARFFGYDYNWYRAYMSAYRETNIANEPETIALRRERAR